MNQHNPNSGAAKLKGTRTMSRRRFVGAATAATLLSGVKGDAPGAQTPQSTTASGATLFSRFTTLPPNSIAPAGWLLRYAQINADGWVLKYAKDAMPSVWGRYVHRTSNPKLGFTDHDEWIDAPDYGSYFGDALVHYAGLFPDSQVAAEAQKWAAQLVSSQDADGYIGGFTFKARWQCWLEVFSQSLLINALLFRYDCTSDGALLKTCERAADHILETWSQPPTDIEMGIFSGHGAIIVRTMGKLYAATGNDRYCKFAQTVLDRYGRAKEYLAGGDRIVHDHDAVATEHIGFPAAVYECSGNPELLKASQAAWEMMQPYLSVDGTPYGNEMIFNVGSRANCEHCGAVEWMITSRDLSRITGAVKYADAVERAMFNGYAAPKSPDGMAVGYMHSPNQLVATEWSQPHDNDGDVDWWASRQHFSTAHEPLCCNANGPRGIPFFIESMVLRSGKGLAVSCYGPCSVTAKLPAAGQVRLTLDTEYPFEDEVRVIVDSERAVSFPVQFRIPGWCTSAVVEVNGQGLRSPAEPGTYASVERVWNHGDKVTLRFVNPIRVLWRKKPEFGIRARCAAIERGPLVFSLPVDTDWRQFVPPAHGPGQDIKAFRLFPKQAEWNYALILNGDRPEMSLALTKLPTVAGSRPWDGNPTIGLEVKARRVLNWRMEGEPEHPKTPGFPYNPMQLSDQVETVTLVPFGATRLRMTYLPIIPA
jgi:hypothetical protein